MKKSICALIAGGVLSLAVTLPAMAKEAASSNTMVMANGQTYTATTANRAGANSNAQAANESVATAGNNITRQNPNNHGWWGRPSTSVAKNSAVKGSLGVSAATKTTEGRHEHIAIKNDIHNAAASKKSAASKAP